MKVYVIMPYGGASPEKKKEFDKIFRFLIRTAIESYDHNLELIRQDYTGEGGHVLANVIENLSQGDIVIADISGQNWNVAYELGIRHSLIKSGTVLICNDQTELPFDIRHMNVITYPRDSWMDEIDEICDRIIKAIQNTVETRRCDSPVHMCFPALPESLAGMLSNSNDQEQKRIAELTKRIQELEKDLEMYKTRLADAGLSLDGKSSQATDLAKVFAEAVKHRDLNSDAAVDHLRELEHEKQYEEFARFLAEVLEHGYLDESDCRSIYAICRRLGIPEITKRYLETVVEFYPDNEELLGFLADEYSTDYRDRDRAQSMVNDTLGVKRVNGRFELVPKIRTRRMLSSFFNVYLHLKKYNELIEIGMLLLKDVPSLSAHTLKNISAAARRAQNYDLSYAAICRALKLDPTDDTIHHALFVYYVNQDDYVKAYEALENAICIDSTDDDYYFMAAGLICDELFARTVSGKVEKIDVRDKERYAFPFVLQAFLNDRSSLERAIPFLKKNQMTGRLPEMIAVYKGEADPERTFADVDMSAVEYCFRKREILMEQVAALPDDFDRFMTE